jgi:hypothetical protein
MIGCSIRRLLQQCERPVTPVTTVYPGGSQRIQKVLIFGFETMYFLMPSKSILGVYVLRLLEFYEGGP